LIAISHPLAALRNSALSPLPMSSRAVSDNRGSSLIH